MMLKTPVFDDRSAHVDQNRNEIIIKTGFFVDQDAKIDKSLTNIAQKPVSRRKFLPSSHRFSAKVTQNDAQDFRFQ